MQGTYYNNIKYKIIRNLTFYDFKSIKKVQMNNLFSGVLTDPSSTWGPGGPHRA